jgi:hypothetical protein
VQAQSDWQAKKSGQWSYELLQERTGECFKVCYRALERASKRGYLECGVSLRTSWVTTKGRQLLNTQKAQDER